jgi:transaldolase
MGVRKVMTQDWNNPKPLAELTIKIFADGADLAGIRSSLKNPLIKGFTTNPTLMQQARVSDYEDFARTVLAEVREHPISFEVFSDEFAEMKRQALQIRSWGENVYVKIPVTNTRREPAYALIRDLVGHGVKVNVTAILTEQQIVETAACLGDVPSYVSVFAGRVADTGRDPVPLMKEAVNILKSVSGAELIWASPREILNIYHAESVGCHVITVTHDLLKKTGLIGKDLSDFSLETVKMFHDDAQRAGFSLDKSKAASPR